MWRQAEGLSRGKRRRSLNEDKYKDQYQKIIAIVESGRSAHSALKETGFPQTAYRYLAQDGIELANTSRGGAIQHERDRIAQALKLVDAGKSYKQAGQVVDRCTATVKTWHHNRMYGRWILNDHPTESESKVGRGKRLIRHDRIAIAYLLDQGLTHREIAAHLGRNQSTISREIARGMTEHGYDALVAQKRAVDRLARPKPRKLDTNPQLRAFVIEELNTKWSPSPWLLSPAPLGTKLGALQSTSVTSSTSLLLCGAVIDKLAGDIHLIRGDFTTVSFLIGIICYSG